MNYLFHKMQPVVGSAGGNTRGCPRAPSGVLQAVPADKSVQYGVRAHKRLKKWVKCDKINRLYVVFVYTGKHGMAKPPSLLPISAVCGPGTAAFFQPAGRGDVVPAWYSPEWERKGKAG